MTTPRGLPPPRFNMARYCLAAHAAATPDKPALVVVDDAASGRPLEVHSFAALEAAVLRVAHALASTGLKRGDRVLIRLANTSTYAISFFAALAGGFVPVPASPDLTGREVDFLIRDSGASLALIDARLPLGPLPAGVRVLEAEDVRRAAEGRTSVLAYADTGADDPAFLVYTSGTTADPKGVQHAHRSAWGRRPMYQGWYGIEASDRVLHAGAFNWTFTLGTGLTDPWANGATAIVYTGVKEPSVWPRLIADYDATLFAAVPGLFRQILKHARPSRLPSLRHGLIAGEAPPAGLFDEWRGVTGTELYEALGMSELSTYVSSCPSVPRRDGAVGKPQAGRTVAILPLDGGETPLPPGTEGLLAVSRDDPGLMLGYRNRPDEQREVHRGRWFLGGDLAAMDEDGYVYHRGRANDLMNAFGYRVSPQEVEAAIATHPGVAEVACAERTVADGVSVIAAYVVPRDHASPPPPEAVIGHAETRLATYKRPREIRFVEALPRTPNGKVKRSALAAIPVATKPKL